MSVKLTLDIILSEVNNKNISSLTSLNINGKNINDISILSKFPTLENISLINNKIKDLNVFKNLKNLKKLNLKDNEIAEFNQIEPLKNCKQLESLCLKENQITKEPNYAQKIKEILPQLKKIDDIEINKSSNNKEIKIPIKTDNKQIDKLNMITNKFIKFKGAKNKNSNAYSGSPMRNAKNKNNIIDINKINSSGKKKQNENNNSNNNSNKKNKNDEKIEENIDKKDNNNNNNDKNEKNENYDDESFEIININDEKKKLEMESKNEEMNLTNSKKNSDILSFSFKKKRTIGKFYKIKRHNEENNIDANATLDNIKIDNNLINTFNDENRNLNYNLSNSKYSRKIIGKFPGGRNILSQSIRYDDENEDENNNDIKLSQKNKLVSLKNRLFSKLTNQIYTNKKTNSIIVNDNEKEKAIITSIKLLLGNLGESELEVINKDLNNAISKFNK